MNKKIRDLFVTELQKLNKQHKHMNINISHEEFNPLSIEKNCTEVFEISGERSKKRSLFQIFGLQLGDYSSSTGQLLEEIRYT